MADLKSLVLSAAQRFLSPSPPPQTVPSVRMDTSEARADCGPGGCGPAPYWGPFAGTWEGTPVGLTMTQCDILCIDQLMYRIVSKIVDDAMNPSNLPTLSGDRLGELTPCVRYLDQRGFWSAARQAQIYARQYGGGGIVCFVRDGRRNDEEIDPTNVENIEGFYALPKWYLTPLDSGSGRVQAGWYGQRVGRPERYMVTPQGGDGMAGAPPSGGGPLAQYPDLLRDSLAHGGNRFHRSRIIPWLYRDDLDLRQARRFANWSGWGPGVVEACLAPYLARKGGALRLSDILNSCRMNVLTMQNLMTAQTNPSGGNALRNALDWIKSCIAYMGDGLPLVAIDSNSKLEAAGHNLAGIGDLVEEQRRFLLDTIEYPEVVIFGSGGATGLSGDSNEGQWRNYYSTVQALRESWVWNSGAFGGGVRQGTLMAQMAKNGPTNGVMDLTVKASWPSLWVDTDKSRAETRLKDAQARASDSLVLGLRGPALARLDPTVQKSYPALDVDDGPLPELDDPDVGEALDVEDAEEAKAAMSPAASAKALVEESIKEVGTDSFPEPEFTMELPHDIVTEKEVSAALKMTRPAFRRWLQETGDGKVKTYRMPRGSRGGDRFSLSEVLGAWQTSALARVDALRRRQDLYPHWHASRQFMPTGAKTRTKEIEPGIHLILEIQNGKSKVQSVRLSTDRFTESEAKKWLKDNGYKVDRFEVGGDEEE